MVNALNYIVNKYNISLDGRYVIEIPELAGGVGLAHLFAELGFKRGIEIGTDQGEFAEVLLKVIPNLGLSCVDPWKAEAYEPNQQPESRENQEFFDKRYQETLDRLEPYHSNIERKTSMEALGLFEDNTLDFVYIDANHDFLNVVQDIHHWLKKVRPGGILSGHDYVRYPSRKFNHVQKAVNAYTTSYHLLPVFLTTPTDKGMRRDRYRSWFICKK